MACGKCGGDKVQCFRCESDNTGFTDPQWRCRCKAPDPTAKLAELERQLLEAYNDLMNTCASLGESVYSYDDPATVTARGAAVVALRAVVAVHTAERRDWWNRYGDTDEGRPAGATPVGLERQLLEAYRSGDTTQDARNADRYRLAIVGRLHLWTGLILEANDMAATDADNLEVDNATASERANANRESWGA